MAVPIELLNARVVTIERLTRGGAGGDITARTAVFTGGTIVNATYEAVDRLSQESFAHLTDGRAVLIDGRLFVDRTDAAGAVIDVRIGDVVTFVDFNDVTHDDAEVREALPNSLPGEDLDHWELLLSGTARGI